MDCARCGRKFFLHSPINALWCGRDQFFICRRCAVSQGRHRPMRCPQCNQPVSSMVPTALTVGVILVVFALLLAPVFYFDAAAHQALANTPQAQISNLTSGETVMIYGNIATNSLSPTLSAYYQSSGKSGGYWVWTEYPFVLYQGSIPISVNVAGISNEVYGAPYESNTQEYYLPGDSIAVVGTVYVVNGNWTIDATAAAPSPADFASPSDVEIWVGSLLVAVGGGVLSAAGYLVGLRRVNAHIARERKPGMYDYHPTMTPPTGQLPP